MTTNLNLSSYQNLQQATFVRIVFTENGSQVVVRFSNHNTPVNIVESDGQTYSYPAVGTLMNITQMTNELKSSQGDVVITLSGIPSQYMNDIVKNPIKAAPVEIRRAFFDQNGTLLAITGNPLLEFVGVVNNFSIDEQWTKGDQNSVTTTIALSCASTLAVLNKQESGRRTNQADLNYWFPGDNAFNRVAQLADAVFDFGGTTPQANISPAAGVVLTGI
jgi:hypothetical protein